MPVYMRNLPVSISSKTVIAVTIVPDSLGSKIFQHAASIPKNRRVSRTRVESLGTATASVRTNILASDFPSFSRPAKVHAEATHYAT